MKFILYLSLLILPFSSFGQVDGPKILTHYLKENPPESWDYDWTTAIFLYGARSYIEPQEMARINKLLLEKATEITSVDLAAMSLSGDPQMKELTYKFFKSEPPNKIGSVDHVGPRARFHWLVPSSIWADSMMMYVLNGFKNFPEKREFFLRQVLIFDKYLKDPQTGLYKHAYNIKADSQYPVQVTWARGNMWMSLGMIEILGELDPKDPYYPIIKKIFTDHINRLVHYMDAERGLRTLIEAKDSYVESSATALFAYVLLKGSRLKILDPGYRNIGLAMAQASGNFLKKINDQEISVEGISGPTTAFKYPFYYMYLVRQRSDESYGVGAFLLLSKEL
jgi:rhamnogalacturonyl hydrolase YesR